LQGKHIVWDYEPGRRVVRRGEVLTEIRIFSNVGGSLQKFVTHEFSAATAIRKESMFQKEDGYSGLISVADLVDAGLLHNLTGREGAIGLVI
jgi:hypothetical protein